MSPNDTDPEIERIRAAAFRAMSPQRKLDLVFAWSRALQDLARAQIRRAHPDASAREVELRLAVRWIGPELVARAFGWRLPEGT